MTMIGTGVSDDKSVVDGSGFLAESANIDELVEEAEGMNILTKRFDGHVDRVMSNSFGFGGTNACLVFDRFTE